MYESLLDPSVNFNFDHIILLRRSDMLFQYSKTDSKKRGVLTRLTILTMGQNSKCIIDLIPLTSNNAL